MNGRQWLYRAFKTQIDIENLKLSLLEAESDSFYLSPSFGDKVQSSPGNSAENKNIAVIVKNEKLQQDLKNKIAEKEKIKVEIAAAIEKISDERIHRVLYARYVNCKTIELIAVENNFNYRWTQRLLRIGEKAVESHIENNI